MMQFTEAIKLKDGIFYNLEYHQKRVNKTASHFYKKLIDLSIIQQAIPDFAKKGLHKCRIVYSDKIKDIEFIPYSLRSIKTVGVVCDNEIDYSHKYLDRQRLSELLVRSKCDDIIIIKNNLVTDSFAANLVFQSSNKLFTPANNLLWGTKRQYLLDEGIIHEKEIAMTDIKKFDRVYFINAMIDLEDTISIDTSSLIYC